VLETMQSVFYKMRCTVTAYNFFIGVFIASIYTGCTSPQDPNTDFFLKNYTSYNDDWMEKLNENQQIDMFYASHRTRPPSAYVEFWIIKKRQNLIAPLRRSLDSRGNEIDVRSYLRIVNTLHDRGVVSETDLSELNIAPLCRQEPDFLVCRNK
jgi:hypothetical protein